MVRVKLSGDVTSIGKQLHVINFTYTLLDEGEKACSAEGNHTLAVFREHKNYQSLKKALEDAILKVKDLTSIDVNGTMFEIQYYIGDWKFLAIVTGELDAMSAHTRSHVNT